MGRRMIVLAGTWRFSPARTKYEGRPYLEWLVRNARAEAGCVDHSIAFDLFEDNLVHHYAVFADEAALAHHADQPWGGAEWRAFATAFGVDDFAVERFEGEPVGAADPSIVHGDEEGEAHADQDERLIVLGGSWRISDRLTAVDTTVYNRYITASVSAHEHGHLFYLNGADLIDPHRINSLCVFADQAALLAHRNNRWVTPEWWRFADAVGLRDFDMTHFRAHYRGQVRSNDLSLADDGAAFARRVPRWCHVSRGEPIGSR